MANEVQLAGARGALALPTDYEPEAKLKRNLRTGMITCAVLVFGLGGMAGLLPMAGAVIASGEVTVATFVKEIAHPTGGVVAQILVHDGAYVRQGQPLLRLDDRVTGANSQLTGESVDQLLARAARLTAERDAAGAISFPPELMKRADDPNVAFLMQQEQRNFQLRRSARAGLIAQLTQRIAQAQAESSGYLQQASSYDQQARLIGDELQVVRGLYEKKYTTLERVNALERASVGLSANASGARTSSLTASARIAELRAQASSVGQEARSQAASELLDVEARISEQKRLQVSADDSYDRSVIRAPQSGVVDKLAFKTIGGVIPPGEKIMEIVPDKDKMVVNVRLPLQNIDEVRVGQTAKVRFVAFSAPTTPEIDGTVTHVSADRTVEQQTGVAYYRATISFTKEQVAAFGKMKLKPGMPVESFIQTSSRTMLSYILRPLSDQWNRAFR